MELFIMMLVILDPFSQVLYLRELMNELSFREFAGVHVRATLLSLGVFVVVGGPVLRNIFQVRLGSLQVLGGLINLFIAYRYIAVGPGTIWLSILMGLTYPWYEGVGLVTGVILANMIIVLGAKISFTRLEAQSETMLGKYCSIRMRTMALFMGAIGVEMIFNGIEQALIAPMKSLDAGSTLSNIAHHG